MDSGNTTTCARDALNLSLHHIPAHELVERMNHGLSLQTHGTNCDSQCKQLAKAVCGWAVKGFPCTQGRVEHQLVKHMYGVVMECLLPLQCAKGQANSSVWTFALRRVHVACL